MLIRLTSGAGGIAEYLEKGRKRGREFERDVVDLRVPLFGNLAQVRVAIDAIQPRMPGAAKYLHITLGFAETYRAGSTGSDGTVDLETIRQVEADFRRSFMVAYDPCEYQYYAEVHLPKIAQELGQDGVMRQRLPHIHVVIPMRNLVDGKYLNPRGRGTANLRYIDALQEVINAEHRLKSPKTSRRGRVPDPLARHTGLRHPLERKLGTAIDRGELKSFDALVAWATDQGTVRIRRGVTGRYVNVMLPGARRGINLKAYSEDHFKLDAGSRLMETSKKLLDEWLTRAAFEARYITSNRVKRYQVLGPDEQAAMLRSFRDETANRIRAVEGRAHTLSEKVIDRPHSIARQPARNLTQIPKPSRSALDRSPALAELGGPDSLRGETIPPDQLKRETRPQLVLAFAARTYGIDVARYSIGKAADGAPRILHEGKQYNLGDFFTKHLGTDWPTARDALVQCWSESRRGHVRKVDPDLWQTFRAERAPYLQRATVERAAILAAWKAARIDIRRSWRERIAKPRLSLADRSHARAIRVTAEIEARSSAFARLRECKLPSRFESYHNFLRHRAERGDAGSLHELRELAVPEAATSSPRLYGPGPGRDVFATPEFRVDGRGAVLYSRRTEVLVIDDRSSVRVVQPDAAAYDLALRVGIARYGKALILDGDEQFTAQIVAAVARSRYPVTLYRADGPQLLPLDVRTRPGVSESPAHRVASERLSPIPLVDGPAHRRR